MMKNFNHKNKLNVKASGIRYCPRENESATHCSSLTGLFNLLKENLDLRGSGEVTPKVTKYQLKIQA